MTYQDDSTYPIELLEQVAEQGLDFIPELVRIMINTTMQAERQKYLGVGPFEPYAERQGHNNGFKSKTVAKRIAPITFEYPRLRPLGSARGVREDSIYPRTLGIGTAQRTGVNAGVCSGSVHLQGCCHNRKIVWQ